jgi:hypothetical protein
MAVEQRLLGMRGAGLKPWRLAGKQRACSMPVKQQRSNAARTGSNPGATTPSTMRAI